MPKRPKGLKAVLWVRATRSLRLPCHWCRQPFAYEFLTVDHEPALAEGGTPRQAVLACEPCNQRRGQETNDRIQESRRQPRKKRRRGHG